MAFISPSVAASHQLSQPPTEEALYKTRDENAMGSITLLPLFRTRLSPHPSDFLLPKARPVDILKSSLAFVRRI
jgi:hypothetical protein